MTLYGLRRAGTGKIEVKSTPESLASRARNGAVSSVCDAVKRLPSKTPFLALITKSANDVAVVVAEALGKTEINFAKMMTAKAKSLGMRKTRFRNASGLPNRRQISTARDMAILARRLIKDYPQFYHFFGTQRFSYKQRTYRNHNKLLRAYPDVDGIKTGYIRASGFNLVASTKRYGRRLIGVVFGGKSAKSRDRHMRKLFNRAYALIPKKKTDYPTSTAEAIEKTKKSKTRLTKAAYPRKSMPNRDRVRRLGHPGRRFLTIIGGPSRGIRRGRPSSGSRCRPIRSGRRCHAPAGAKPAIPGANCWDVAAGRCEVLLVPPSSTTRLRRHSADHTITVDTRTAPSSRQRRIDIRSLRPSIDRGRLRCRIHSEPPMPPPCSTPATATNRPDRSHAGRPPR